MTSRREALDREQLSRAWEQIGKLPTDRRQALVLRFVEEMSTREIGEVLDRSEGATRVLIHRALQTVARQIGRGSDESTRLTTRPSRPTPTSTTC